MGFGEDEGRRDAGSLSPAFGEDGRKKAGRQPTDCSGWDNSGGVTGLADDPPLLAKKGGPTTIKTLRLWL